MLILVKMTHLLMMYKMQRKKAKEQHSAAKNPSMKSYYIMHARQWKNTLQKITLQPPRASINASTDPSYNIIYITKHQSFTCHPPSASVTNTVYTSSNHGTDFSSPKSCQPTESLPDEVKESHPSFRAYTLSHRTLSSETNPSRFIYSTFSRRTNRSSNNIMHRPLFTLINLP